MTETPTAAEHERIVDTDVSEEMQKSFLEYAYSVIYARALPDARDGLKPVQRRILFQMDQMGLRPDRGHVKSQRVVGEVMGKLHPHGDSAIYDALVRLSQSFNLRLPLIDGHGNFGSLDDGPAAARYTEARLASSALDMVCDLDEDVVNMIPNYDNQFMQPEVLPAAFPNMLVNGASGIAVGMATNIAPHNLGEVVGAACHLLDNPQADLDDLMRFVPGPDLPEGGTIIGLSGIREAYECGRGIFKTRAKVSIERVTARKHGIIVSQLPYMVGPERVIEKLKDGVNKGRIKGVSGVVNLTDRHHGLRLVIEIKNGFNPEAVLASLYRHTPLEESFGINAVALVDGQPKTLGLRELLQVYLNHRISVVTRRSKFRLDRRLERLHLIEGLLIAVVDIDEVIAIIRSSDNAETARGRLEIAFGLSQIQAEHILALRLRRLTKFSRLELEAERDQLDHEIAQLKELLGDEALLRRQVRTELEEVSAKHATARRTVLLESEGGAVATSSVNEIPLEIPDEDCTVVLSASGLLAALPGATAPKREGPRALHDALASYAFTTTRSDIGLVLANGAVHRIEAVDLPQLPQTEGAPSFSGGVAAHLLVSAAKDCAPVGVINLSEEGPVLAMATRSGVVKRVRREFPAKGNAWEIISLNDGDEVVSICEATDDTDLVLISSGAQLLRTPAQKIRPQGRTAAGMAGMALKEGESVIAFNAVPSNGEDTWVTTVATDESALPGTYFDSVKVSPLGVFPVKGRGGQGVRAQRFLAGETSLVLAHVSVGLPRAIGAEGAPIDLPAPDERRSGSGQQVGRKISAIG